MAMPISLTNEITEYLLIIDYLTRNPLVSKDASFDLPICLLPMQTAHRNYHPSSLEKHRSHVHSKTRLACSLALTTRTIPKPG